MPKIAVIVGCTACDSCRWVCPSKAISFDHAGAHIDGSLCLGCGLCVEECASSAITLQSKQGIQNGQRDSEGR